MIQQVLNLMISGTSLNSSGQRLPNGHLARIPHGAVQRRPSERRTPLYKPF